MLLFARYALIRRTLRTVPTNKKNGERVESFPNSLASRGEVVVRYSVIMSLTVPPDGIIGSTCSW